MGKTWSESGQMTIRYAKPGDIEEVAELDMKLDGFEKKFDSSLKIGKKERTKKWLRKRLKDRNFKLIVTEKNSKIIGYTFGWIEKTESFTFKKRGYICDIFILKEYRGKGIGSKLVKKLLKWFKSKGIRYVEVEVYSENKRSFKLWKYLGFREIMRRLRLKVVK